MKNFAYQSLEKIMNQALSLDPEGKAQMADLAGHTVVLDITDWKLKLILVLTTEGVRVCQEEPEKIDALLSGSFLAIVQTACSGGDPNTMRKTGLRIEGDIQLAEKLKHILSGLDIDWEAPLSRFLGPTVAGGLGLGIRRASSAIKNLFQSSVNQVSTYLKTDSGCLATQAEITQFNRGVSLLRHDVDRLEARVNQLEGDRS
jgi:ubiquinone biosynthesis protein UbiJ